MDRSLPRPRAPIARKPPLSLETRYPDPDPNDPFAPLWVLRTRSSNPAIDLRGLYDGNSAGYHRRSQSTPAHAVVFPPILDHPPAPSLLTSESGSSTDVDTISPSKPAFHVPRFFLARLQRKTPSLHATTKSISPPHVSSALPDLAPIYRAVTCDSPTLCSDPEITPSFIPRKPPTTLKKPVPSVPNPTRPATHAGPTPETLRAESTPELPHRPARRPHSSHTTPSPALSLAPHPHVYPPPDAEWHPPTPAQLAHAASLPVIAASGLRVPFASLFAAQRTVVVFLRHFWCPLCQDYMSTLVSAAQPHRMFAPADAKDGAGTQPVHLVVISNGAHAFIPKYRQLFGLPFEMYTDPELRVYRALGMGRDGFQPKACAAGVAHVHGAPLLDGGYARHGLVGGIAMVVMRALRTGMPVWEKGGDIDQLGGEFVLGPGLQCSYAHRMQTTKGHAPIADVLKAAGVAVPAPPPTAQSLPLARRTNTRDDIGMTEFGAGWDGARTSRTAAGKLEGRSHTRMSASVSTPARARDSSASLVPMTPEEEERWMAGRAEALERLRARKSARRGAFVGCLRGEDEEACGVRWEAGLCGSSARTRAGPCSPVWEEDGEVLVIGFAGERGGESGDGRETGQSSPLGS